MNMLIANDSIFLPTVNAFLNLLSTICLILGFIAIRNKRKEVHIRWMISAFIFSTIFLSSYLYYHYQAGSKTFPELGWIKNFYLFILIPHVILATGMVPFIFLTFFYAWKKNWAKHKRIAKITFPIWLYVSITGVLVYLMLYQFFRPIP